LYRFQALKKLTDGMLDSQVYRRLHDEILTLPDLDVVEIGAASGTGSIAIAWALREASRKSKLVVVEKCERGSRDDTGGYEANLSVMEKNWARFGVTDHIRLFPHQISLKNGHEVLDLVKSGDIAAFMHDADGRIDRDFFHFWPRLIDGGLIVVDDVEDAFQEKRESNGELLVLGKRVLTWRLLHRFQEWGLFEPFWEHHGTIFGRKPAGATFEKFDIEWCKGVAKEVYAECEARARKTI
jgi:precorrin-6B methylase 2